MYVYFLADSDKSIGLQAVKDKIDRIVQQSLTADGDKEDEWSMTNVILVSKGGLSSSAEKTIREVNAQARIYVEHFLDAELLIDITEHELVPTHEVLTEDEKETLLARYKLREHQLPKIQSFDPVARYFGLRKGDVVKITRDSETAGKYITYRICIDTGSAK